MNGLKTFLFKLIPIVTLLCFIAFGVETIFGNNNLTYITHEQITITNPTTNETTTETYYTYNLEQYIENIDISNIQTIFEETIDTTTIGNVINSFGEIWEDGYQILDGVKTLVNALVTILDCIIFVLNLILFLARTIFILLRTLLSLIGWNYTAQNGLNTLINGFINLAQIPMIPPWL